MILATPEVKAILDIQDHKVIPDQKVILVVRDTPEVRAI